MADPTVTDVFNQLVLVNGKLDQVEVNTSVITNLNTTIATGFNNTVNALNTNALINIEAVKLLFHLTQQAETMICILEHISKNTCCVCTQATIQTGLQKSIADDLDAISGVAQSAYPEAALNAQKLAELKAQIEKCCPPEPPRPACEYKPCDKPRPPEEPKLPEVPRGDDTRPPR